MKCLRKLVEIPDLAKTERSSQSGFLGQILVWCSWYARQLEQQYASGCFAGGLGMRVS
jgi:hypothetical protein